ncbi:MAG: tetratricopeptide repeat protein [Paracoccaceae bacterium]
MTTRPVWWGAVLLPFLILITGCNSANFELSQNDRRGPPPPLGTKSTTVAVDGMIVGDRLMAANEFELALSAYQRAATVHGVIAEVLSAMGAANLRLGRLQQAKVLIEKALEKDDKSVSAWNNFGVVLMNLNEPHQAREAFKVAFGIDNGNSELIRQNLILANKGIKAQTLETLNLADFMLVRHGNGSYFLLGN